MGRSCFHLDCVANKLKRNPSPKELPSFFRFPKKRSLYLKWKKAVPPRPGFNARDPTAKDYLCSLHFKLEDVEKFFEYKFVKGLPQTEIIRMERGTWSLKEDAIPCYFKNNNPNTKQLLREVKHRSTNSNNMNDSNQNETVERSPLEQEETNKPTTEGGNRATTTNRPLIDNNKDNCRKVMLDHCYYTTLASERSALPDTINSLDDDDPDDPTSLEDSSLIENPTLNEDPAPIENPSVISCPASSNKAKTKLIYEYDPYTIEQLHQDVLDIVLPKGWTFFQSDDDLSTVFMFHSFDGAVFKSVSFKGSCRPEVTINSFVLPYKTINSKKDVEELLELVTIVNY